MSPSKGPCVDYQLGLWKSTNSDGNVYTAKCSRKQFASRQKKVRGKGGHVVICTSILLICCLYIKGLIAYFDFKWFQIWKNYLW